MHTYQYILVSLLFFFAVVWGQYYPIETPCYVSQGGSNSNDCGASAESPCLYPNQCIDNYLSNSTYWNITENLIVLNILYAPGLYKKEYCGLKINAAVEFSTQTGSPDVTIDCEGQVRHIEFDFDNKYFANDPSPILQVEFISFQNGYSVTDGGSISIINNGNFTTYVYLRFENCTFYHNQAANKGGAISHSALTYDQYITPQFMYCDFSNNSADYGGAVYLNGLTADVYGSTFSSNSAVLNGGAVYSSSQVDFAHAAIFNNTAMNGGGIYMNETLFSFTLVTVTNNNAVDGGGVFLSCFGRESPSNLVGFYVSGNVASQSGGGFYLDCNRLLVTPEDQIVNKVFDNKAQIGGGFYLVQQPIASRFNLGDTLIFFNEASLNQGNDIYLQEASGGWTVENGNVIGEDLALDITCFDGSCLACPFVGQISCPAPSTTYTYGNDTIKCLPQTLPACQNGGSCVAKDYYFSCECPANWTGNLCDTPMQSTTTTTTSGVATTTASLTTGSTTTGDSGFINNIIHSKWEKYLVIGGGAFLFIVLVVVVFFVVKRRRHRHYTKINSPFYG
eukprot:TRINITY_DN2488_c0_g1_i1.p1 TRINITY_DN2488_c0_g1~~TRINITY_DN2488_c0_g1_i1.p1  ORF type:complete len:563 (-),score=86.52 TRINITY_DN2488_c0_g1_i1:82-1770(-)